MNYWLLLIPVLATFSGWLIIRLAIRFIFRPLLPTRILGITVQGIIPRYQQRIATAAGKYAASQFNMFDGLEKKVNDPSNFEKVKPIIEVHIDDFLRNKLKEQMPMISMFIGDKTITSLKTVFIKEIENLFPQVIGQFAGNIGKDLDIAGLISSKIAAIPPAQIESLVYKDNVRYVRLAALFGALIGFITGLIQLLIILFLN